MQMFNLVDNISRVNYLQSQVDFLHGAELIRDLRGHSRTPNYIIKHGNELHYAKLYPGNRVKDLATIAKHYMNLQIPTAKIVHSVFLPYTNETFCIYEYISGPTLNEILPTTSVERLENIGRKVGHELAKFSKLKIQNFNLQKSLDQELVHLFNNLRRQYGNYNSSHIKKLPPIDLGRMEKSLRALLNTVISVGAEFAHTDINLANVIIHDDQPYIIDTDGSRAAFRALNFRGNCWWLWNGQDPRREQAIYRGIYQGMFDNQIPVSFHQELAFTMIYEFLARLLRHRDVDEETYYSFLRWREDFLQTNYFEDYQFTWF